MTTLRRPPPRGVKAKAPETTNQAHEWDKRRAQYRAAGFCELDAAAAAWGHQLGFAEASRPCVHCTGLPAPAGRDIGARALAWIGEPSPSTRPTPQTLRAHGDDTPTCQGCSVTWRGLAPAHCSACHETFSGVSTFDEHRKAGNGRGRCLDPLTILDSTGKRRMVRRADGVWRSPRERVNW